MFLWCFQNGVGLLLAADWNASFFLILSFYVCLSLSPCLCSSLPLSLCVSVLPPLLGGTQRQPAPSTERMPSVHLYSPGTLSAAAASAASVSQHQQLEHPMRMPDVWKLGCYYYPAKDDVLQPVPSDANARMRRMLFGKAALSRAMAMHAFNLLCGVNHRL